MVTMRDIAAHAKVSQPAVSLILNGKSRQAKISEATRKRVLEIADQLGYRINAIARSMRTGHTGIVGMLLREQVVSQWRSGISDAQSTLRLQSEFLRQGIKLLLAQVSDADIAGGQLPEIVTAGYVDALLISSLRGSAAAEQYVEKLREHCPRLLVTNEIHDTLPSINRDNYQAGALAAEYLAGLGHRRMAIVGCDEDIPDLQHRAAGFCERLRSLCPDAPAVVCCGAPDRWRMSCGALAMAKVLDTMATPPDAVLGLNDFFAIGALQELRRRGIAVPATVSVVGIGELEQAAHEQPALTTVSMDLNYEVEVTAEMTRCLLAGRPLPQEHCLLPCRIIERCSVRKITE